MCFYSINCEAFQPRHKHLSNAQKQKLKAQLLWLKAKICGETSEDQLIFNCAEHVPKILQV